MRNREITYYTLAKLKKLIKIYRRADNTTTSEVTAKLGEKKAKHLWIKPNNEAFLIELDIKIDSSRLSNYLHGQLMIFVKKYPRHEEHGARKNWLNHTIHICEEKFIEADKQIYKEVIDWCKEFQNNSLESYSLASLDIPPTKKITHPAKALFCKYVNDSELIEKEINETVESYCIRICNIYELEYSDKVRQDFTSSGTKSNKKKVHELILPRIDKISRVVISNHIELINNENQNIL